MTKCRLSIFCADVGSIKQNKFGWAALLASGEFLEDTDIETFSSRIATEIQIGNKVAIGFECPLFVPVRADAQLVNSARKGEGNRSWSAGAGTGALATGLVETIWVMNRASEILRRAPVATLNWDNFQSSDSVFLWEAFVTSASKGDSHSHDAKIAVETFCSALPNPMSANAIQESSVFSLIGAAAMRTGWSEDVSILSEPCLVIKA